MSAASCKAAVDGFVQGVTNWTIDYQWPGAALCSVGSPEHQTLLWFIQFFLLLFGAYGGLQLGLTALLDAVPSSPYSRGEKVNHAASELSWLNWKVGGPLTFGTAALIVAMTWKVGINSLLILGLIALIIFAIAVWSAISSMRELDEVPISKIVHGMKRRGIINLTVSAVLLFIERAITMPFVGG